MRLLNWDIHHIQVIFPLNSYIFKLKVSELAVAEVKLYIQNSIELYIFNQKSKTFESKVIIQPQLILW